MKNIRNFKALSIPVSLILIMSFSMPLHAMNQRQEEESLEQIYSELPFKMQKIQTPAFQDRQVSIVDFGAVSDGRTLCSDAIAKAISYISEAGGGTVLIPNGLWLTGPIELKSNVCLKTVKGTVVIFTKDYEQYPLVRTSYEGTESWRVKSPLYAYNATNISIEGQGIFDGGGDAWRPVKKANVSSYQWRDFLTSGGVLNEDKSVWYPTLRALQGYNHRGIKISSYEDAMSIKEYLRPVMLNFIGCKNVKLEDIILRNSPAWCLHPLMCEQLSINRVSVINESWAANGDAIDLESCRNVAITDCLFNAGDDGICMKSGKDEEGRKRGIPTENVIISGCTVFNGHGGFVVGSEMSGGVRNIFLKNCSFIGTDNGLRFKSTRGRGGVVENIYISNIDMANIKDNAILYDLYYGGKNDTVLSVDETTPCFRNISMKNIVCNGAKRAAIFQGLPEMKLNNIRLEDAVIESDSGIECVDSKNIFLKGVSVYLKNSMPIIIRKERDIAISGLASD